MGDQKTVSRNLGTVYLKTSNVVLVRLPKLLVERLGFKHRERVRVKVESNGNRIILTRLGRGRKR